MKKRIDSQSLLLMVCLLGVCLHSVYLLLSSQMESFLICGVFACYLLFAVARRGNESREI